MEAYNRCIEEGRRGEDLPKLHEKWSNRRIESITEPQD